MANIKSQIKRIGQNNAARDRNKTVRSAIKTTIRKFNEALVSGDASAAKLAKEASKQLDKAVSKGVIHKNQASNKKSANRNDINYVGSFTGAMMQTPSDATIEEINGWHIARGFSGIGYHKVITELGDIQKIHWTLPTKIYMIL